MKQSDIHKLNVTGLKCLPCGVFLACLFLAVAGCRTANVSPPLVSHPAAYHRVAILPVCFGNPRPTDYMTSTGDSEASRRQSGEKLTFALTNQLARKGYQVVGPVQVLCCEDDWSRLDLTAGSLLRQQFDLERICSDSSETNECLYTSGFASSLPVLQERLGLPEADAVVLVERWLGYDQPVYVPPPPKFVETATTLFGLAAPFFGGDTVNFVGTSHPAEPAPSIHYSLDIFDSRTQEVIYSAHRPYTFKNPARAVRALLGPLPKIKQ